MTDPTFLTSSTHLSMTRTTFINRVRELAMLDLLLGASANSRPSVRLITLTGPGGVGKTRLALEAVPRGRDVFSDGVKLLDLTTQNDGSLVLPALASALGVLESTGRPLLDTVVDFLRAKRLLLWLDNCEYWIDACARLVEHLLRFCPQQVILATSREELKVPGERVLRVEPLAYPRLENQGRDENTLTRILHTDAVQLLVDRVRSVRPEFKVTEQNAQAVARICRGLDGLPLALELAAVQAATLTVEQIAERLADRLQWPVSHDKAWPERQRTLRAVMDWSYSLLTAPEQTLLRRLSVFADGFTLDLAERVCLINADEASAAGQTGMELIGEDILDLLGTLTEKSLLVVDANSGKETRLHMLETVRQYALDQLVEAGEERILRERHAADVLRLVEAAEMGMMGRQQTRWQARLTEELGNVRAALTWAVEEATPEIALRLAGSMYLYWMRYGLLSEGRGWLTKAVEREQPTSTMTRAKALLSYGALAWLQDETETAREAFEQSITAWRQAGNKVGLAYALAYLGMASLGLSSTEEARSYQQQWTTAGDKYGLGYSLIHLGMVAFGLRGTDKARALVQESLALLQAVDNQRGLGVAFNFAGLLSLINFDLQAAQQNYEQSLVHCRAAGDEWWLARVLYNLGRVVMWTGDANRGRALHEESLALRRALDDRLGVAASLASLGDIARLEEDIPQARRYYEEALPLFRQLGPSIFVAWSLENLGFTLLHDEEVDRSDALFQEALRLSQQGTFNPGLAIGLVGLAGVALRRGHARRAARLLGAAETVMAKVGRRLQPVNYREYEGIRAATQAQLPAEVFDAERAEGAGLPIEAALAYALSDGD